MDTSKEYILMCEKAEEIQDNWQPKLLDNVITKRDRGYITNIETEGSIVTNFRLQYFSFDNYEWINKKGIGNLENCLVNPIWLPHQDQLQEIITQLLGEDLSIFELAEHHKIDAFYRFVFPDNLGVMPHPKEVARVAKLEAYVSKFKTQEQLWLAFVVKEKYNKIFDFNAEEWQKE